MVSARLDAELLLELDLLKSKSGMSVADVLRVGLNKARPPIEMTFGLAYKDAEMRYKVNYLCSGCGRDDMSIQSEEEKEAAAELMYRDGWYCPRCR